MSRPKPRILLDVDGPLTLGFFYRVCARLRAHGVDAQPEKLEDYDVMRGFNVPPDVAKTVYAEMQQPGVAYEFDPREGTQAMVARMREWAEVWAVTAPLGGPHWAHDREEWLHELYEFDRKHIISARDKTPVRGAALVDDKPETIHAWSEENRGIGIAVLWRESYNRHTHWSLNVDTPERLEMLLETWFGKRRR